MKKIHPTCTVCGEIIKSITLDKSPEDMEPSERLLYFCTKNDDCIKEYWRGLHEKYKTGKSNTHNVRDDTCRKVVTDMRRMNKLSIETLAYKSKIRIDRLEDFEKGTGDLNVAEMKRLFKVLGGENHNDKD